MPLYFVFFCIFCHVCVCACINMCVCVHTLIFSLQSCTFADVCTDTYIPPMHWQQTRAHSRAINGTYASLRPITALHRSEHQKPWKNCYPDAWRTHARFCILERIIRSREVHVAHSCGQAAGNHVCGVLRGASGATAWVRAKSGDTCMDVGELWVCLYDRAARPETTHTSSER
jgi:hypothetical protein